VLDLCAGSGAWSEPYRRAGYLVWRIDLPSDVRLIEWRPMRVHGILAAPPCTMFASSGARWERSSSELLGALSVVDACLRAVAIYRPVWWALENPIGILRRYLGPPTMRFHPTDYGDGYPKRTLVWGAFNLPRPAAVVPTQRRLIHHMPDSLGRQARRSMTPAAFAAAFQEANP
jgi:hypothetical protein